MSVQNSISQVRTFLPLFSSPFSGPPPKTRGSQVSEEEETLQIANREDALLSGPKWETEGNIIFQEIHLLIIEIRLFMKTGTRELLIFFNIFIGV